MELENALGSVLVILAPNGIGPRLNISEFAIAKDLDFAESTAVYTNPALPAPVVITSAATVADGVVDAANP